MTRTHPTLREEIWTRALTRALDMVAEPHSSVEPGRSSTRCMTPGAAAGSDRTAGAIENEAEKSLLDADERVRRPTRRAANRRPRLMAMITMPSGVESAGQVCVSTKVSCLTLELLALPLRSVWTDDRGPVTGACAKRWRWKP